MQHRSRLGLVSTLWALAALVTCATVYAFAGQSPGAQAPQKPAPTAPAKSNSYIGAQKCLLCHSKAETGNQHAQWLESKHSQAFATLATDAAKKVAQEKGLGDPQKEAACVKCHQTAHGVAAAELKKGFDPTAGVQCETCHGPGELHMKARLAAAGTEAKGYPKMPADEIIALPTEATCRACHNPESPTFKPFCVHERMTEIKHWNPLKPRTAEQQKGYPCKCNADCICKKDSAEGKCRSVK